MKILDIKIKRLIFLIAGLVIFFRITDIIWPVNSSPEFSKEILAADSSVLHVFLTSDQKWRLKISGEDINPVLRSTMIYKEDQWFYIHPGINPFALMRAFINNIIQNRRTSGASTITMQLARMLDRKPRNYINKFIEMFRALQLEYHYSKPEIFEMYLNLLPYGGNIEGVKAASMIYYDQNPKNISLAQTTALTIIPNDPNRLNPVNNPLKLTNKRNYWLNRFQIAGLFSNEIIEDALSENKEVTYHPMPRLAPHLSVLLKNKIKDSTFICTTINQRFQEQAEQLTANHIRRLLSTGITNASAIVIDGRTHEVKAYVGSSDFYNSINQGQVDGVRAVRSPGSALKPFLYALAFDEGLYTPKATITDIPENFSGYEPDNYDGHNRGLITIEDALALSLNIPAVKVVSETGVDKFVELLSGGGMEWISANRHKLGLSVILGGCGVNLIQLTALYTAFLNYGVYQPVTCLKYFRSEKSDTIFSPESSFMITEILTHLKRPDLPREFIDRTDIPKIAWKTGTSYGRRDAWAIGYNSNYCVGVWLGNFNNKGVPGLNGTDVAVPLLFDIFRNIEKDFLTDWFTPPESLQSRIVCNKTGLPPDTCCHDLVLDYYIPGASKNQVCDHLKAILTNPDETISYCRSCCPATGYKTKLYPNLNPGLALFYESENIAVDKIPEHNPLCERLGSGLAPVISTLTDHGNYLLLYPDQQMGLLSHCQTDVSKVFWYVNKRFYQEAPVDKRVFFKPVTGINSISCVDDQGRKTSIDINVEKAY